MSKIRLTKFAKVLLSLCLMATTIYNTPIVISATEDETIAETTTLDESTTMDSTAEESSSSNVSEETSEQVQENIEQPTPEVEVTPEVIATPEVVDPIISEQPSPVEPEVVPTVTPEEIITTVEPTAVPSEQPVEKLPTEVVATETPVATQFPEETIVPTELPEETLFPDLSEDDRLLSEEESMLYYLKSDRFKVYPEYLTANDLGPLGYKTHESSVHPGKNKIENCQKKDYNISENSERPQNRHYVRVSYGESGEITYVRCDRFDTVHEDKKNYLVEYFYNDTKLGEEPVVENESPNSYPKKLGEGYWTKNSKNGEKVADLNEEKITSPTIYYWHENVKQTFTITTIVENGTITQNSTVAEGDKVIVEYKPNEGYELSEIFVDGNKVDIKEFANEYTFDNINKNHEIKVVYSLISKPEEPVNLQPVYVYAKVYKNNKPLDNYEGLSTNNSGYYTIGVIKVPIEENLDGYKDKKIDIYEKYKSEVNNALNNNIERFEPNLKIDISKINNWKLHNVYQGADDYVTEAIGTWHLDGIIDIEDIKLSKVIYTDNVTDAVIFEDKTISGPIGSNIPPYGSNPSREGYTFAGWNTMPNGTGADYNEQDSKFPMEENGIITFYAKWEKNTNQWITVEFKNSNDKQGSIKGTLKYERILNSAWSIETPETEANIGYLFDGWYENDQRILEFPKTINKNHTYEARWAEDKNGNQVPDKYDAKVTFRATNGLFEGGKETIVQEYVLAEIKDGVWTPVKKVLGSIPKAVANEGFENGTWVKHTPTAETQVVDGAEYTIEFAQIKRKLKINYVDENGTPINKDIFHETELNYGESYSIESPDFKGYVLENQNQAIITGTMDYENIEINVVYLSDKNSDSIPDKYQVNVVFAAVNGSFIENGKTQVEKLITLVDAEGNFTTEGSYTIKEHEMPKAKPAEGYNGSGNWDKDERTITKNGPFTYTITFNTRATVKASVETYFDNELVTSEKVDVLYGDVFTVDTPATKEYNGVNYLFESVENNNLVVDLDETNNVVRLHYVSDANDDDIADKYQVRVDYEAVNGSVSIDHTYVTLFDEDGKWSEDGIGHLTEAQIPTTSANDGYHNGTWDIMPTTALDIIEDTTFTITFVAIPEEETEEPNNRPDPVFQCPEGTVWNDNTGMCDAIVVPVPVDPGNNPPVGPVNPGVNVEDEVDIPEVDEEDIPEIIVDDEPEETPEIVEIEDEETPEAGGRRGHWALINLIATVGGALLALILLIGKHQKDADDEADENAQVVASEMDEEDEVVKRRRKWKYISTIVAVISVVIFFLTENMSLSMVLVDKYTMLMLVLFLGNVVCLYMGKRWHEADEEEQERA